jgi:hypothetical protein
MGYGVGGSLYATMALVFMDVTLACMDFGAVDEYQ